MNNLHKLRNAAFGLAKDAHGALGHAKNKRMLEKDYGDVCESVDEIYYAACRLADSCYDYADKCRIGELTKEEAIKDMKDSFPGYAEETYTSAFNYGYFISR